MFFKYLYLTGTFQIKFTLGQYYIRYLIWIINPVIHLVDTWYSVISFCVSMDPRIWHKVAGISGKHTSLSLFRTSLFFVNLFFYITHSISTEVCCFLLQFEIGITAIGLGTYGAHVFKPQNQRYKEVTDL